MTHAKAERYSSCNAVLLQRSTAWLISIPQGEVRGQTAKSGGKAEGMQSVTRATCMCHASVQQYVSR